MTTFIWISLIVVGLLVGVGLGYQLRRMWAVRRKDTVETKVEEMINEAKAKQKEILLQANEKALAVIEESKAELREQQAEQLRGQKRLEQRESMLDQKILELDTRKQELLDKATKIEELKAEIGKIREQQLEKLTNISGLDKEAASKALFEAVEKEQKEDIVVRINKLADEGSAEVEQAARNVIALAMQRVASSHATENSATVVDLPSDEMKGRIIGREGRNIRTIEQLTGTEIIVDDTPNAITISGFSPIRRHVAKRALDKLLLDGRIHPARIEESVDQAKREISQEIRKAGEDALYELGITGVDPKLVQILGLLRYRTSYGQNILQHSIEVAHLSGILAQQLGADVSAAKKAGLFHDIGKAVDHEVQGSHTEIGYDIMKKFGMPEEIAYVCIAHHEDRPKSLIGIIAKVADAISGARPGARKDTYEQYLKRLEELEKIATRFDGVEKAYAIQAGREVRIFVAPEQLDDLGSIKLAKDIARAVENELKYPGEIRVTLIRETRITEYAR